MEHLIVETTHTSRGIHIKNSNDDGIFVDKEIIIDPSIEPQVGDTIEIIEYPGSCRIHKVLINGKLYKDAEDPLTKAYSKLQDSKDAVENIEQYIEYLKTKPQRYAALHDDVKHYIDVYDTKEDHSFEQYTMMCCEQATLGLKYFKTSEEVKAFADIEEWEDQLKIFPELDDGHSMASFNLTMNFIYQALLKRESVKE